MMKVRTKFTLWISLSSLLSALFLSTFIFVELIEEPHKLINRELTDTGNAILQGALLKGTLHFSPTDTDYPVERYWIKLIRGNGELVYASPLASKVEIPLQTDQSFYTVTQHLSPNETWIDPLENEDLDDLDELDGNKVKFKVLVLKSSGDEELLTLIIAKPIALLSSELRELINESLVWILTVSLLVFCFSYFMAGRILRPISIINNKIRTIRENSLDERIPLGKSEDELHTLTSSLNSMFDRLQNSFEQQREFVSGASHEMRSPLTILMLGHEEILGNDLPEKIRTELSKQLITMQRLNKLVKDLLDISLLERQEYIERTEIILSSLIDKVLGDFDVMLQAYKIQCTVDTQRLKIHADYDKLLRVFINLIDNAIKFNQETNRQITITTEKKGGSVLISIVNTGKEIPADDLQNVFKQFYRVEKSRSKKYGGTGLGLTIVKRIIELHGGTIWLESGNQKTTVYFTLPIV